MNTRRRQLAALTGVRFFLALWVVVYHQGNTLVSSIGGPPEIHRIFECFVRTGYSAVSAFFILSGFVLTYNYDFGALFSSRNAVRFGIARFSRIYPAYATGLLLLIPFAIYRVAAGVAGDGSTGPLDFVLNACLLQSWVPGAALSWNFPGWSLSDEAFFYAVFPWVGLWTIRIGEGKAGTSGLRLLGLAAALWMLTWVMPVFAIIEALPNFGDAPAANIHHVGGIWANAIRFEPLLRLPEFCIGVALALLYRKIPAGSRLWKRGALFYIPAIAAILLVLSAGDRIPYPLMHNGLLAPAYAAMIFGFALEGGILVRFLSLPAVVFLGGASYSMYILHMPIYGWMSAGFMRVLHLAPEGIFWVICYVTAVVGLSAIFFKTAEEPAHRWLRTRLNAWEARHHQDVRVSHV